MATETAQAEQAAGMPQLDFSTFPNQIFWLVVTMVVIYFVLSRVALPRIASVLAERQGTITNDIAAAEDLKHKAHAAEEAYERALADARSEAQAIVAEARAEIQKDVDAANQEADAEIAAKTAEAESRIAAMRESAKESVSQEARETAQDVVNAIAPMDVDNDTVLAAVDARLKGNA
jgi:F-type H+-transporting ATPase subunit b